MATKFQIKRTSVSGRTPNTTNSGNSSYIAAGELALNLTDEKLYSSNGTVAFEVGANLTNLVVSNTLTANQIILTNPLVEKYSGTVTYTVAVLHKTAAHRYYGVGSAHGYTIDGIESPYLSLLPGKTYKFDQSDASNLTHPLRFYVDNDKTKQFTDGVTTSGTAGNAGAYTQIVVSANTPATLHYQCSAHPKMGNQIQVQGSSAFDSILVYGNASINTIVANGSLGTAGKVLTSNSLGGLYWETPSSGITVELVNTTSNVTTLTTVSTLQFDENSGFNIVNVASGKAKVEINSTFKFWQVDGVQKLTATGLDTVNFIAGDNITITANGANTPQSIAFSTSLNPTFTTITIGNSTVNTFANSSTFRTTRIIANGVVGTAGKVLTSNGTGGIYWGDSTTGGGGGDLTIISDTFSGNGSNTVFTLSVSTETEKTFVYLNGILQVPTTDYSVSNTTLTFVTAPPSDNAIEVRTFDIPSVADLTVTSDSYTANGTQTAFTLSTSLSSDTTSLVFLNGVTQVPTTDYGISGSTLTFVAAPANGTKVQVTSFTAEDISTKTYTGNGSNTEFTLGTTSTTSKTIVSINGVTQTPVDDYSVSGTTLVFAVAPANGDKILARSIPSTASSTAGGNTQIQYNKSGSLGGSAGFTFNEDTNNVVIANTLTVPNFILNASNPPANSTSTGSTGTFAWDSSYFYIATGTNTWKKVPITTDGSGGGAGSGVGITRESFTGNGSNTVFTLSDSPIDEAHLMVYVDRVLQRDADYNVSGTTLSFVVAPDNGADIDAYVMSSATQAVRGVTRNAYTGNGSNTVFTLGASSSNAVYTLVFVDTVFQPTTEYTISGTTITFNTAPDNGVPIEVVQLGVGTIGDPQVAGSNNEIQYHSSNSFAANNKFTFNPSTTTMAIGGNLTINTSAIFIGNSTVNTTIIAGNVDLQGTQLRVGNVVVNGNQLVVGNVTITDAAITVGNSTVNTVLGSTGSLSGNGALLTSVDAATVGGNTASTLRTYSDTVAATAFSNAAARVDSAYSNAASYADTKAATAYSNATSYADTKAATAYSNATSYADTVSATAFTNAASRADSAYSNAVSYADTKAATAYSNATSYADTKAATAYSNATSYADTKASAAYSNAIAYSGNAAAAYTNAVAYAASNTYVNNTFLPLAGGTLTGALTVNATANVVANLAANNVTIRGDLQIDGNLVVSGTSVVINAASLAVEDNMIYLNNGSQVTHPDLGFAGNYNDGTYKHAGFFRDATDGVWKVFDGYTPEPDASAFIDTSNASFRIANFTANVITANSFSGNGASVTSVDAATLGGNTAATLRSYSDTVAATAFSNAASRADSAYSNAISYAATIAATAYSNAISYSGNAALAYSNAVTYASNATNLSSGTVAFARLPALYLGTTQIQSSSAAQAVSGITTLAAGNTTITGFANISSTLQVTGVSTLSANLNVTGYQTVTQDIYSRSMIRATGWYTSTPAASATGLGVELGVSSGAPYVHVYNRDAGTYGPLNFHANSFTFTTQGTQNGTTIANSSATHAFFASNGNVGIGTTSPFSKLQAGSHTFSGGNGMYINGRVGISNHGELTGLMLASTYNDATYPEYGLVFVQGANTSNYNVWSISPDGPAKGSRLNFIYEANSTNIHTVTPKVVLCGNGNVGIGTSSPTSKFHINHNGLTTSAFYVDVGNPGTTTLFEHTGASTPVPFRLRKSGYTGASQDYGMLYLHMNHAVTGGGTALYFTLNDSTGTEHEYAGIGGLIRANTNGSESGDLFFMTSDSGTTRSEKVRIISNGNVGIGNTAPTTKLSVNGTSHFGDGMYFGSGGFFSWTSGYSDGTTQTINFNSVALATNSSSYGVRQFWASNGNVGIGTITPSARLHIDNGTGTALYINTAVADTTTRDGIYLFENSGQATGRQAISWYNGNQNYYKARISTQVGSDYAATRFSIEVANNARTVAERFYIQNGDTFITGNCTISGTLTESSSITIKENVDPITNALNIVSQLSGVTYDRKDGSAKKRAGLIAEEVQQVLPNIVQRDEEGNPSGIQYTNLIAYLVESIKELKAEIDTLKGK